MMSSAKTIALGIAAAATIGGASTVNAKGIGFLEIVFTGAAYSNIGNIIELTNLDGTTTVISGTDFPDCLFQS